jgi:hypothetical protein
MEGKPHDLLPRLRFMPFEERFLQHIDVLGRVVCPSCGKRRFLYCYSCVQLLVAQPQMIPHVHLPLDVDLIKHISESDSKSTALHAKLLAPDQVTLYAYPQQIPEDVTDAILLFPCRRSVSMEYIDWSRVKRLIVLDGTWNHVQGMSLHPNLQTLPCVRIEHVETMFWRSNGQGKEDRPDLLATIEAIYYFFCHYAKITTGTYQGQYDDLLFLFVYYYMKVRGIMSLKRDARDEGQGKTLSMVQIEKLAQSTGSS